MAERRYELVVHGATGFSGRQALAHLGPRAAQLGLRWAIAGRDERRLAMLATRMPEPRPAILVADATDPDSLAASSATARAVISFLGPHAPLGDLLPEQCVASGTHYADLCGENDVIATRLARLDGPAREAGVKLIPACGFESVPFDLGVLELAQALRAADGSSLKEVDAELRFVFKRSLLRFGHGNSGGTLATVARLVEAGDLTDTRRFVRAGGHGDRLEGAELDLGARRSPSREWLSPLVPTPFLNPAVAHLTNAELSVDGEGYSPAFAYREALNMSASFGSTSLGALGARGASALLRRIAAMSRGRRSPGDRAMLAVLGRLTPRPGSGPSLDSLDAVDYRIDLRAGSTSGLAAEGIVRGSGHPGYRSSPNILVEAGIALTRSHLLPGRSGVLTPACGLGREFAGLLAKAGLEFEVRVLDGTVAREHEGAAAPAEDRR